MLSVENSSSSSTMPIMPKMDLRQIYPRHLSHTRATHPPRLHAQQLMGLRGYSHDVPQVTALPTEVAEQRRIRLGGVTGDTCAAAHIGLVSSSAIWRNAPACAFRLCLKSAVARFDLTWHIGLLACALHHKCTHNSRQRRPLPCLRLLRRPCGCNAVGIFAKRIGGGATVRSRRSRRWKGGTESALICGGGGARMPGDGRGEKWSFGTISICWRGSCARTPMLQQIHSLRCPLQLATPTGP
ncbi:hypothetical protein FIBSPDRAFT_1037188 [Athelia psychrophila]|uniref:Uncharacterized protein n=1 Tax=Athelia psychrophila TaxID=1759441 RepID=A0A166UWC1_9AGAM|nr:hypothetical protein FIBSPDRAFT_1037188 [Fibularhizoctonia sp. CBS 109695]